MVKHSKPLDFRLYGSVLGWSAPACLMGVILAGSGPANADLTVPATDNHGTVVTNGTAGDAVLDGGLLRGGNLFQRLQNLDTSPLNKVEILTKSNRSHPNPGAPVSINNLFLSVLTRAVINKPINLESQPGMAGVNMYVLSPQGIAISGAGTFTGVNTLVLTTSGRLDLGNGTVYGVTTTDAEIAGNGYAFDASSVRGLAQVLTSQFQEAQVAGANFFADGGAGISIQIGSNVQLSIARSLFLVANQAPIKIDGATLVAKGNQQGTVVSSVTPVNHTTDLANTIVPAAADGIAIVGRDIEIIGSSLKTNSQFLIREPLALAGPAAGVLASPIVPSFIWNGTAALYDQTDASRRDTMSRIYLASTNISNADSAVASAWGGMVNMLGFGNRNGKTLDGNITFLDSPNPSPVPVGGTTGILVDTVDPSQVSYLGGYAPLNASTASSTGRLAYTGLRIDGLTIQPSSAAITSVGVTIGNDWGFARNLVVDTRAQTALISRGLRFVQGYRADAAPGSVTGGAAVTGNAATSVWNLGKINALADPANAYVSYVARWWDGGDVTNNNITIAYLSTPGTASPQARNPDSSPKITTATAIGFDQVLFNFDQTVFSDADTTARLSAAAVPGAPNATGRPVGVELKVSMDVATPVTPARQSSTGAAQPSGTNPTSTNNSGGNDAKTEQDDDRDQQNTPASTRKPSNAPQVR